MGGYEVRAPVLIKPSLKYHSYHIWILTGCLESGPGTVLGGQFDWGGLLPKSNGGAQWYTQHGRQSCVERKGISVLDCETNKSIRCESRP